MDKKEKGFYRNWKIIENEYLVGEKTKLDYFILNYVICFGGEIRSEKWGNGYCSEFSPTPKDFDNEEEIIVLVAAQLSLTHPLVGSCMRNKKKSNHLEYPI